jgi:GNAT superfamily N-acetyltransferase
MAVSICTVAEYRTHNPLVSLRASGLNQEDRFMEGPRACRPDELAEAISLTNAVFRAGTDQDIGTDYPLIFNAQASEHIRILLDDGRIVAQVPVAPRQVIAGPDRFNIGIIAPTVTHPDYRLRGYGRRCLQDAVRHMEALGCDLSVLWTMERTFPFYQGEGWEAVASQGWAYALTHADASRFPAGDLQILPLESSDNARLDEVIAIHKRKSHRVIRSREEYRALLSLPKITTWLALADGRTVAYLTDGKATNKSGIIEGAGEPAGIEALLRRYLATVAEFTQALIPLNRTVLGDVLDRHGIARRPIEDARGVGYQMVRVNHMQSFLKKIAAGLGQRAGHLQGQVTLHMSDSDERVTLSTRHARLFVSDAPSDCEVSLSRRQMAQLFFGGHASLPALPIGEPAGAFLATIFPYYFAIPELDHC